MSKHQMIEQIRAKNRSASADFLVAFDEQALESYLKRLTTVHGQRGPASVWVRQATCRAIVTRAQA